MAKYPPPKINESIFNPANFFYTQDAITQADLANYATIAQLDAVANAYPNLNSVANINFGIQNVSGSMILPEIFIGETGTFLLTGMVNITGNVSMYAYTAKNYVQYGKTISGQGSATSYISFSGVFNADDANTCAIIFGAIGSGTFTSTSIRFIKISPNVFPI
jgi:hypothetical protein